ncbi:MAG: hypothetical protein V2I36_10865 [Desulfopila sp.]|jgi:3-hydroxyacyl-[acyl-carrier-protein] dehydratase|nr:hypothetical protein [Desulfopila sp.]
MLPENHITGPLPLPAGPFLPHRPPMLLLDKLVERKGGKATASAHIGEGNICMTAGGALLPESFIEILAQTMAAANGYDATGLNQHPKSGFIVGLEQCSFQHIPQNASDISAHIVETMTLGALKAVQGEVFAGNTAVISAELKVWEEAEKKEEYSPSPAGGKALNGCNSKPADSIASSVLSCINDVYVEEQAEKLKVSARCIFSPSFCGFAGHFPENPILPAIVQLATVRTLAEQALQQTMVPETYSRVRFKSMVKPDQVIALQLDLALSGNRCRGKFHIRSQPDTVVANGSFSFRRA